MEDITPDEVVTELNVEIASDADVETIPAAPQAAEEVEVESDLPVAEEPKKRAAAISRSYPRRTLEDALRVPNAIKENNGGQPWQPQQVAKAIGLGMSSNFYYITAASRDYGLTTGTSRAGEIAITALGRTSVYPGSPEERQQALLKAFFSVDIFKRVVQHYGGSKLPEAEFRTNTLINTFALDSSIVDEFVDLFEKNCRFLGIGTDFVQTGAATTEMLTDVAAPASKSIDAFQAPPTTAGQPICFIAMPFSEHNDSYPIGFFAEVLSSLFFPAIIKAGLTPRTAKRQGSDLIHRTIVTELLDADLVLCDLTEHNPNVLSELGMRMNADLPVVLTRAKGTGAIFDVDNLLRVEEYNPNLWKSTVDRDIDSLSAHIRAAWDDRDSIETFMKILRQPR